MCTLHMADLCGNSCAAHVSILHMKDMCQGFKHHIGVFVCVRADVCVGALACVCVRVCEWVVSACVLNT